MFEESENIRLVRPITLIRSFLCFGGWEYKTYKAYKGFHMFEESEDS